jgi:hypothetical protein
VCSSEAGLLDDVQSQQEFVRNIWARRTLTTTPQGRQTLKSRAKPGGPRRVGQRIRRLDDASANKAAVPGPQKGL